MVSKRLRLHRCHLIVTIIFKNHTMTRFPLQKALLLTYFGVLHAGIWAQELPVLSACAGETAPFVIISGVPTPTGFSISLFNRIAEQLQQRASFKELPWARCLEEVKAGRIDLAIDAYEDAERRKEFLYTLPYHTLTPQVFYRLTDASRLGFPFLTLAAMQKLRVCGVHGYTYEHYGLEAAKMDMRAKNDQTMLAKLALGRCDYAVEELEYVIGGRRTEKNWPDESDLSSLRPAWAKAPQVHFLIGRAHPKAQELQYRVNEVISTNEKNGFLNALRKTFF